MCQTRVRRISLERPELLQLSSKRQGYNSDYYRGEITSQAKAMIKGANVHS